MITNLKTNICDVRYFLLYCINVIKLFSIPIVLIRAGPHVVVIR